MFRKMATYALTVALAAGGFAASAAPAHAQPRAEVHYGGNGVTTVSDRRHWRQHRRHARPRTHFRQRYAHPRAHYRQRYAHPRAHFRQRHHHPRRFAYRYAPRAHYVRPPVVYRHVVPRRHAVHLNRAHVAWCHDRYRSYRAWDNSFQPYHGPRRQCWSPYI